MRVSLIITLLLISTLIFSFKSKTVDKGNIERGEYLFKTNCASCHKTTKSFTARPIQRIREYRGKDWAYRIVQNPAKFASENKKVKALFSKSPMMTAFNLTKADIDAIYDYLDSLPFDPKEYNFRR